MSDNLERRLRGEITTITTNPEAGLWALRKEAATKLAELRTALEAIREQGYLLGLEAGDWPVSDAEAALQAD
jgi:hypothetical protein